MENFNKMDALKYLVEHSAHADEWTGAGMYIAVESVIQSDEEIFSETFLKKLLGEAANY